MMGPSSANSTDAHDAYESPIEPSNRPMNGGHVPDAVPLLLQSSKPENSDSDDVLRSFRVSLRWCALDHSSWMGMWVSVFTFVFLAALVPLASSVLVQYRDSSASDDDPISFNKLVQLPVSALASIGFFTLSMFFRKYSLRQLLFLEGLEGDSSYVQRGYRRELDRAFRYLAWILLPSFLVELTHKIVFFLNVTVYVPCISSEVAAKILLAVLVLWSWVYRTGLFLLVCVLFRLTCELQILRFQGFRKLLEGDYSEPDMSVIFREHARIKTQLSATSHRYRCFIIGCLVTITVSQFGALLLVLASEETKTFFNSGDLIVCSAVQLSGFCLCLVAAAKITHRAQGLVGIATRWHLISSSAFSRSGPAKEPDQTFSDSDIESVSWDSLVQTRPISLDLPSFHIRQALVAYLQHNSGGVTIYGFALDRGLLHTLFAFEFSLVLWILSKVVVLSSSS
ncbi:hypothetical protein SAY86_007098 [Trapa natans]|uniref:Uncharacterized protein n=1 Tax=Trapa natans TaxID=22666 RepID=A0AAN7LDY6_TRANT|nr:hypothetical protein SAY86_007098 [Trapa natans]